MLRTLALPRDVHAPALARREVAALGLDSGLLADASLLVSELVTNSVLHGAGTAVRLRLETDDRGGLRCEVLDDGAGFVPTPPAVRRDAGGWGLQLVDRLADRWGVADGSTHVWFELGGGVRHDPPARPLAARVG
jgi:anti-sigma regulatory factor (Ser/Thr protein kinase)